MAAERRGLIQRHLRTLFDVGTVAGLTDGQLLERFASRRDEAAELAFAALVERHGPMVLHVSRGILRDEHEAMDVFQATFLVLARKGRTLWVRDSLGPWLHRVACRAAGRARKATARRRAIETRWAMLADAWGGADDRGDRKDVAAVVHEEVDRLPERYRSPVVLCDLEGYTCEAAARHLGCPVGTVASRLARGRQRLRDRLRRRGLAPDASLLAAALRWQGAGSAISAELAGSTARAAVQFVSIGAAVQGTAASLATEILSAMSMTPWWKVASLLLVMTASASGVVAFAGKEAAEAGPDATKESEPRRAQVRAAAGYVVQPGPLRVNIVQRGSLESLQDRDVYDEVEGRTKIISIVPEGTRVKKGDLVCELDSAALKEKLADQSPMTLDAEAVFRSVRLSRQTVELALAEYENGIYPQRLRGATGEIARAESAILAAENRLKRTQAAHDRVQELMKAQEGRVTAGDILTGLKIDDRLDEAQQRLGRERSALELAQLNRNVLEKFTKTRTTKELSSEVDKARFDEQAKERTWELEKAKQARLLRQIAACSLRAPGDGLVVYANDVDPLHGPHQIKEGAVVSERQKIFSVPDLAHMRVNTWVDESIVDRLSPGQTATVQVDAFPDRSLTGSVVYVAPRPDPKALFDRDVKVYPANVDIKEDMPGLRPGMTAKVDILVAELDRVLSVPLQAVIWHDQQGRVAVKTAENTIEWREVTLGLANNESIEVKEGLKSGETVVLNPEPFLTEDQKRSLERSKSSPQRPSRPKAGQRGKASPALRSKGQVTSPDDEPKNGEPDERAAIRK